MRKVIFSTYRKCRLTTKRAFPWSFTIGGIISGISAIIFPYFIYVYLFNRNTNSNFSNYTQNADYMTYITLGAAVNVLAVSILLSIGRALITEIREGTLDTFLLSPASRIGYFLGTLLEQISKSLVQFITVLIVGYILGANLIRIISFKSIFVLILSIFSFFSIGLLLSSLMLHTRDTYITQNTLFLTMTLVCGISFPVELLPKFMQYLSHALPVTSSLKLFRIAVTTNDNLFLHFDLILETILVSLIYMIIGLIWFKKIEKKLNDSIFG